MSLIEIADTILLKPLYLVFEIIYTIANRLTDNPGASIVVLSLVMNFLVLPLYKRADAMQEEERQMELKLHKGVTHIKKTFHGDEQMLMLQTYYRQNHYKPAYVLRGATSLLLEIPFFIAAYRFLSGLQLLNGVRFGLIADLGKPDGLFQIGGTAINVLPFLMTAVNLASCVIFTKGSLLKTKLQLYGMAVFFLIFLYGSPSGLVFYWTLNNIFSLIKTVFYKLKNPKKIINLLSSTAGGFVWIYGFFICQTDKPKFILFFAVLGALLQAPAVSSLLHKTSAREKKAKIRSANKAVFFSGCVFLSVLTGILIPSAVIKSSPQEFISGTFFTHPIWFIVSAFCLASGFFVVWLGVFYWLAGPSVKPLFDRAVWIFSGIAVINYMFFNRGFGILTSRLKYESELKYTITDQLWNFLVLLAAALLLYGIYQRFEKRVHEILIIGIVAFAIMAVPNITHIHSSVAAVKEQLPDNEKMPEFTLSKTGKNVVVLMLDRAMGTFLPYLFEEKPNLKEQFAGFTYYSNTLSFGKFTNFGVPALLGGYEYSPAEMNKRDTEPLVSKHNEAVKLMPVLFDQNGFDVTVCNPIYANYQWNPDLSIFDEYPDIKSYSTGEKFLDSESSKTLIENNKRNFFCYSILKTMPWFTQGTIYNDGKYNQTPTENNDAYSEQTLSSIFTAEGISANFMMNYTVLENLPNIVKSSEEDTNTFLFLANDTTHEPMLLQTPDYVPSAQIDNTEYEASHPERILDGRKLKLENGHQVIHYHANMAAMLQLGNWFDYLRREGVYDNTRIILVSDHARGLFALDDLILNEDEDLGEFFPLLMVKDFGSTEFTVSDEFMTNADVPTLATDGLIDHPVNPFTGKEINSNEKTAHDQYVINSSDWQIDINNGNQFILSDWFAVHDNIWDINNWKSIQQDDLPD